MQHLPRWETTAAISDPAFMTLIPITPTMLKLVVTRDLLSEIKVESMVMVVILKSFLGELMMESANSKLLEFWHKLSIVNWGLGLSLVWGTMIDLVVSRFRFLLIFKQAIIRYIASLIHDIEIWISISK